jgi:nucleoside permease NupC
MQSSLVKKWMKISIVVSALLYPSVSETSHQSAIVMEHTQKDVFREILKKMVSDCWIRSLLVSVETVLEQYESMTRIYKYVYNHVHKLFTYSLQYKLILEVCLSLHIIGPCNAVNRHEHK